MRSSAKGITLLGCLLSPAAALSAAPGFSNQGAIVTTYSGTASLDLSTSGITSPMACSNPNNYRLPSATPNFSTTASLIITGFASNKHEAFWVSGCDTDGTSIITSVIVAN